MNGPGTGAVVFSCSIALVHTERPFEIFKKHIRSLDTEMVITEADPVRRVVTAIVAAGANEATRRNAAERFGYLYKPLRVERLRSVLAHLLAA